MSFFASKVRQLRRSQKMTQQELAAQLHVSLGTISIWERGARLPDLATIQRVASFFNVPFRDFFTEEEQGEAKKEPPTEAELMVNKAIEMLNQLAPPELAMVCAAIEAVYDMKVVKSP